MQGEEQTSTVKKDSLQKLERDVQQVWDNSKAFEANRIEGVPKFMATFPIPYMNGRLHIGHTFTMSKVEFAIGFERMNGKKCLFPFGFHCTGMPIKACADKIRAEISTQEEIENTDSQNEPSVRKGASKKSKLVAKSGAKGKTQSELLQEIGVPAEEIPMFADAEHWLKYFPPRAVQDLKRLGLKVDWRRSFITTDMNPYFDSFVSWYITKMKNSSKIKFGKRYTVFSPKDGQACLDHDRSVGEGVQTQEYTLIKMKLVGVNSEKSPISKLPEVLAGASSPIYLIAATLRPETMYGQTNCWVAPKGEYGIYRVNNGDLWICSPHSARNMAYQDFFPERGLADLVATISGSELLGLFVEAPFSSQPTVPVLPLSLVSMDKGTGIVTSVPSDAPDDYIGIKHLQDHPELFSAYLSAEVIKAIKPIQVVSVPGIDGVPSEVVCQELGIKSPKDVSLLAKAKDIVYSKSFYEGVMVTGDYSGKKVMDAKALVKQDLIKQGHSVVYQEPESRVVSRSGDECVVSLEDQWFIVYGEEEWKEATRKLESRMQMFSEETRNQFEHSLDWLQEWACTRSFGLGTKLPWDKSVIVESLSDSTIYMAYYTICHLLQGDMYGSTCGAANVLPSLLTPEVWEHIFLDGPYPAKCNIDESVLKRCKDEFNYWYPLDLRVSGKDLIQNHLTMWLYHHVAIFPESKWPKGVRVNGHLLLNSEKMSKSTGNFLSVVDAIEKYSADAVRFALACAGDSTDDANFEEKNANMAILRLSRQLEWMTDFMSKKDVSQQQTDDLDNASTKQREFLDAVFESQIKKAIVLTSNHFQQMHYREALKEGFFEMQTARDKYRSACSQLQLAMNVKLVEYFIEVQALLVAPIVPHFSEHVWQSVLKKDGLIIDAKWPSAFLGERESVLLKVEEYLETHIHRFRKLIDRSPAKKNAVIYAIQQSNNNGQNEIEGREYEILNEHVGLIQARLKLDVLRVQREDSNPNSSIISGDGKPVRLALGHPAFILS